MRAVDGDDAREHPAAVRGRRGRDGHDERGGREREQRSKLLHADHSPPRLDRVTRIDSRAMEEPVALVRAMFEAFTRRDLEAVLPYLDAEVELQVPSTSGFAGRVGPYRGHTGIREYFADVAAVWDDLVVEPEDYRATESAVLIFGRLHGRSGAQSIETRVLWTWKLRAGKVISGSVFDTP